MTITIGFPSDGLGHRVLQDLSAEQIRKIVSQNPRVESQSPCRRGRWGAIPRHTSFDRRFALHVLIPRLVIRHRCIAKTPRNNWYNVPNCDSWNSVVILSFLQDSRWGSLLSMTKRSFFRPQGTHLHTCVILLSPARNTFT